MTVHPVIFAGAGPGDPELITVKGKNALEGADVVIYAGSLVPEAVLKWTKPGARILNSASMNLEEIVHEMETAYKAGLRTLRLHTGDPSLYGAIFEQIVELRKRDIAHEIIPGVTAAFAAAAEIGMEYTLPEISQTLILTRMAGRTPVPENENLASLAAHQSSMAIYLSMSLIDQVAGVLAEAYGDDAACIIAYRVSQPDQRIIHVRLGDLARVAREEDITRQALIIVGKVLNVRPEDLEYKSKLYDKDFSHGYR